MNERRQNSFGEGLTPIMTRALQRKFQVKMFGDVRSRLNPFLKIELFLCDSMPILHHLLIRSMKPKVSWKR